MKITLKTIVLIALLAFFILIVVSNFSNLEGFTATESNRLPQSVTSQASTVDTITTNKPTKSNAPTTSSVPTSTSSGK